MTAFVINEAGHLHLIFDHTEINEFIKFHFKSEFFFNFSYTTFYSFIRQQMAGRSDVEQTGEIFLGFTAQLEINRISVVPTPHHPTMKRFMPKPLFMDSLPSFYPLRISMFIVHTQFLRFHRPAPFFFLA